MDILGPTREGGDQDGAKAKYAVVTVLTVPVKKSSGEPLVMLGEEEEVEGAGEGGLDLHPEEEELPRGPEELPVEEEDLFAEQEERGSAPGEEGRVEVEKAEEETRKWKEKIKDLEDVAVRNLTFAIPIRSRNRDVVLQAVAECYSRYRAAGLQVLRVHTDRAREFTCAAFRAWAAERRLWRTVTAGDEPQANGRCENEVGVIKGRTKVLLEASGAPKEKWPLALRHAAELRWRSQMRALGVPQLPLVPFGRRSRGGERIGIGPKSLSRCRCGDRPRIWRRATTWSARMAASCERR